LFEELVEELSSLIVVLLQDADLCLRKEVPVAALVDDVFEGDVGHVEDGLFQEEVHQVHEQVVVLLRGETLVSGLDGGPLYYFDFELKRLRPEILRQVALAHQLIQSPHEVHLGNSHVLSAHFMGALQLVQKREEKVGKHVLPIFIQNDVQVVLSLTIVLPLNIQRRHHQLHISVQPGRVQLTDLLDKLLSLDLHAMSQGKLGVVVPHEGFLGEFYQVVDKLLLSVGNVIGRFELLGEADVAFLVGLCEAVLDQVAAVAVQLVVLLDDVGVQGL